MSSYTVLDFLNQNSLRAFPFRESLSRLSTDGVFKIPDSFIVDFLLTGEANVAATYFVSTLNVTPEQITIELSRELLPSVPEVVGTFTINVANFESDSSYTLVPNTDFGHIKARLTVGDLTDILNEGVYAQFSSSATTFEMRTVIPNGGNVTGIVFKKASGTSTQSVTLTGAVVIELRHNLKMGTITSDNTSYFALHAGENLGMNATCGTAQCVTKINGIAPDSFGNILIKGDDACVTVGGQFNVISDTSVSNVDITVQNNCCPPCMGCDKLTTLAENAAQIETSMLQLKNTYMKLNLHVANLATNVNKSCPDCKS